MRTINTKSVVLSPDQVELIIGTVEPMGPDEFDQNVKSITRPLRTEKEVRPETYHEVVDQLTEFCNRVKLITALSQEIEEA